MMKHQLKEGKTLKSMSKHSAHLRGAGSMVLTIVLVRMEVCHSLSNGASPQGVRYLEGVLGAATTLGD